MRQLETTATQTHQPSMDRIAVADAESDESEYHSFGRNPSFDAKSSSQCRPAWFWIVAGALVFMQSVVGGLTFWHLTERNHDLELSVARLQVMAAEARLDALTTSKPVIEGKNLKDPTKLLLDGITPTDDQAKRGDCWLFAITGILEDSYRRYGVERGWLAPDVYLRLSRQALGIRVMDECRERPSAMCPAKGFQNGTNVYWGATTEGADERMLYFFHSLSNDLLPKSVCPYSETPDGEHDCAGMHEALAVNPLRFNVTRADMYYDSVDMKRALVEKQQVITIGTPMVVNEYYLPCTKATAKLYASCPADLDDKDKCVACPVERAYAGVGCCIAVRRPMVSMRGEWHHRVGGKMILIGAHALDVVGYSDSYTDEWGNVGGFILRNSWNDGLGTAHGSSGRGSHSAAYYMRDVFDFDEALVCPNPHSPRSWYVCKDATDCRNTLTAVQAQVQRRPLILNCIDNAVGVHGVCEVDAKYYMTNLTEWDSDGLFVGCFLRVDGKRGGDVCAPPLLIDDLAQLWTPDTITHYNDPDVCGYNFVPYATLEAVRSRFGAVVSSSFTIEWTRESYASQRGRTSRAPDGRELDYSLIEANTLPMPRTGSEVQAGALWV